MNNVHTCLSTKNMYMYILCIYIFIYFQNCMNMCIHFTKNMYMSEPCLCCVCTIAQYILHTRHIHVQTCIHVYTMWSGFQMVRWLGEWSTWACDGTNAETNVRNRMCCATLEHDGSLCRQLAAARGEKSEQWNALGLKLEQLIGNSLNHATAVLRKRQARF